MPSTVAVVGPARGVSARTAGTAREVGRRLAEAGAVLVTGGLGGVMAEASRGAAEAGGVVVGLLPGGDAREANQWVGVPLPTGLGEGRNLLVVAAADSVISIGGSWGTLGEVALACRLGIPVVTLGDSWQITDSSGRPPRGGPVAAAGAAEAVNYALRRRNPRANAR